MSAAKMPTKAAKQDEPMAAKRDEPMAAKRDEQKPDEVTQEPVATGVVSPEVTAAEPAPKLVVPDVPAEAAPAQPALTAHQKLLAATDRHQRIIASRDRRSGPGADPLFEPIRRFFPEYEVHKVPVPSKAMSQSIHDAEVEMLNHYTQAGFVFLTEDMVSHDGRHGTCPLASFDVLDGRVIIGNYYAMLANRALMRRVREGNIESGKSRYGKMLSDEAGELYDLPQGARVESQTTDEQFDLLLPRER